MENTLSLLFLPTAVLLGALHALEPGHAKTLTAAYLIGVKGTRRDAVLLGLAVASTHSIVVIGLSVTALCLGRQSFTDAALYWLQVGSALIVTGLGAWMLWRRWPRIIPHTHAPDPVTLGNALLEGKLEIANLAQGERFRLVLAPPAKLTAAVVRIQRDSGLEVLVLTELEPGIWLSSAAPAEPHSFKAEIEFKLHEQCVVTPFEMHEPEHDHSNLSEDAHARAHAGQLPAYVKTGQRPSVGQILMFGTAGGLIPCPASITVMLLALTVNELTLGVIAVLGFSLGLALTLVGIGLAVVAGLQRLGSEGRFAFISRYAPQISAAMVMLSGLLALIFVH